MYRKNNIKLLIILLIAITLCFAQILSKKQFLTQENKTSFINKINTKNEFILKNKKPLDIKISPTIYLNKIPIDILQNDSFFSGDILVLPGWNFKRNLWCDSTDFCIKALKKGYRLIMPEMGKSIYSSSFFPETRKDWKKYPNLIWVTDTLIPHLMLNYGIFQTKNNFLLGLSTGARGSILLGIKTDTLFKKAACLSGDYNQLKMPKDNLITGYYGNYYKFKSRWENFDNPLMQFKKIKFDIYLGHGINDKVVSYKQTIELYDSLKKNKKEFKVILNTPNNKGHNFSYWGNETDNILNFYEK
jgi:hypothetical protein